MTDVVRALTIALAIVTASSGGQATAVSFGSLWPLPGILSIAASLVVGLALLRAPQQVAD
jgi:hypothetical protein